MNMREHWQYQGSWPALGFGEEDIEGQICYFFRRENIGVGGTTHIIPRDVFHRFTFKADQADRRVPV